MVLGHFSDSYPEIIGMITLESRTDNYKVASEILAFFQGSNCRRCSWCLNMVFWVCIVSECFRSRLMMLSGPCF